jgi:hypothetical protein
MVLPLQVKILKRTNVGFKMVPYQVTVGIKELVIQVETEMNF